MSLSHREQPQERESTPGDAALVLALDAIDRTSLPTVGGKAANLGELIYAGFAVPAGFCVTTAAYKLVSAGLEPILAELAATRSDEVARLEELASAARATLLHAPVPTSVAGAVTSAYQALSQGEPIPVSVRSSATAEDLPEASFAGQQETYLNIIGVEAVLSAVQHCWASLWTDRAISYRASLGLDPRGVRLAVIVQRLVKASVAGVLFTANPLTGKRCQVVLDANPGLGEAVASGATNPDHFVVNTPAGEIVERHLGDKRVIIQAATGGGTQRIDRPERHSAACLSDPQIRMLAELGAQVEAHYGSPQDIEWAIDASGQIFLLQARPITTLFPLPAGAPSAGEGLRVYLSFNIQQGTYQPSTPMGIAAIRLLTSSLVTFFGFPPRDRLRGPGFVTEAGSRIFLDVTAALRSSFGRRFLLQAMGEAEVQAATIFQQMAADPRLSLRPTPRGPFVRTMIRLFVRSGLLWKLPQALLIPRTAHTRLRRFVSRLHSAGKVEANAPASVRLATVERLLFDVPPRLLSAASPVMLGGMGAFSLAGRLLGDLATEGERQIVLRGAPGNPTTEMNLALWALSEQVQADPSTAQRVRETPPAELALDYREGELPPLLQQGLSSFLATYGHRGVAELDEGQPRWSEDPAYVFGILAGYLRFPDSAISPAIQFRRGAEEAEAMVVELTNRARRKSRLRGLLVGFFLSRARALVGLREMPRFCFTLLVARVRALLRPVGEELVRAGRLSNAEDISFLTLSEAYTALAGSDLRVEVRTRRAFYNQERVRRRVPLVLLSDGTEPTVARTAVSGLAGGALQGTPASPGVVTAVARVILDPHLAHLEHGEILVAPSTDPGWTPLFLQASGLVMEMGGAMSHGAIVAREYGIPAVVGVSGATEHITTGSRITIDGAAGTVMLIPPEDERNGKRW
jgi:phosphohistidine swiveling domain-containing protein